MFLVGFATGKYSSKNVSAIWLLIKSRGCFWQQSIPVNEKQSPVWSPIGHGNKKTETQQEINMETVKMVKKYIKYGNIL